MSRRWRISMMASAVLAVCLVAGLPAFTGCASTAQPSRSAPLGKEIKGSGFLGDLYSLMHDGKDNEPLRIYRNPKFESSATFAEYRNILLDPVVLYAGPKSKLPEASEQERETIAQAFYSHLYNSSFHGL